MEHSYSESGTYVPVSPHSPSFAKYGRSQSSAKDERKGKKKSGNGQEASGSRSGPPLGMRPARLHPIGKESKLTVIPSARFNPPSSSQPKQLPAASQSKASSLPSASQPRIAGSIKSSIREQYKGSPTASSLSTVSGRTTPLPDFKKKGQPINYTSDSQISTRTYPNSNSTGTIDLTSDASPRKSRHNTPPRNHQRYNDHMKDLTDSMRSSSLAVDDDDQGSPIPEHRKSTPILQKVKRTLEGGHEVDMREQAEKAAKKKKDAASKAAEKKKDAAAKAAEKKKAEEKSTAQSGKVIGNTKRPVALIKKTGARQRIMSPVSSESEDQLDSIDRLKPPPAKAPKRPSSSKKNLDVIEFLSDDEDSNAKAGPSSGATIVALSPRARRAKAKDDAENEYMEKFNVKVVEVELTPQEIEMQEREAERLKRAAKLDKHGDSFFGNDFAVNLRKQQEFVQATEEVKNRARTPTPEIESWESQHETPGTRRRRVKDDTKTCPFCAGNLPLTAAEDAFYELKLAVFDRSSTPPPGHRGRESRIVSLKNRLEFCSWHDALNTVVPAGEEAGYPTEINFMDIPNRLEIPWIQKELDGLAKYQLRSQKFQKYADGIESKGRSWWLQAQMKEPAIIMARHVGYYGDMGRAVITQHFHNLIQWGHLPTLVQVPGQPFRLTPFTTEEYIDHILVPEAGLSLIMDDLAKSRGITSAEERSALREEAEKLWMDSMEYGKWKFRETSRCEEVLVEMKRNKKAMKAKFGEAREEDQRVRAETQRAEKRRKREIEEKGKINSGEPSGSKPKVARTTPRNSDDPIILSSSGSSTSSDTKGSDPSRSDFMIVDSKPNVSSSYRPRPTQPKSKSKSSSSPISTPGKSSNSTPRTNPSSSATSTTGDAVNQAIDDLLINVEEPTPKAKLPLRVSPPNIPPPNKPAPINKHIRFPSSNGRSFDKSESFGSDGNFDWDQVNVDEQLEIATCKAAAASAVFGQVGGEDSF